jgi:hypothetical protein
MQCRTCGSEYSVTYTKVIFRDQDDVNCQVCGHQLASWSSSRIPSYKLENAAAWPKAPRATKEISS